MDQQQIFRNEKEKSGKSYNIIVDDPINGIPSQPEIQKKLKELEEFIGETRMAAIRGSRKIVVESRISRRDQIIAPYLGQVLDQVLGSRFKYDGELKAPYHCCDLPRTHKVKNEQRTKPSPGKSLGKKKWWEHK